MTLSLFRVWQNILSKKEEEEEVRQKSSVTIIMSTNNDNDKQLNYRCVDNMEQSLHQ